ncbi:MAG: site-specific integrase [Sulfurospirillaceae bacterium]|nr:site-specific integrase [Sulfurospirillaceae bacterium]
MSLIVSAKSPLNSQKEINVEDMQAIILNRSNRKFWYIRYTVFFKNQESKTIEESTKVLKTEKTQKFMEQKYLPVWLARKKEEMQLSAKKSENFGYYCSIFLSNYKQNYDYQNAEYRANRILLQFGHVNIKKITKLDIKLWLNSLTHSQTGADLSKNSKLKYLRILHGIFEVAADDGVVKNFTYEIKLDAKKDRNTDAIKPFEKNEVLRLLSASRDQQKYGDLLHYYLGIAINQGMSPAEILALQLRDIDFVNQTISIQRNITKGKVKETKTKYRDRVIPIFDATLPYFEELVRQAYSKKSLWLFSNLDGSHLADIKDIRGDRLIVKNGKAIKNNTKWYKLLSDLGIEYRDLKNCRHTFAVSAIESKAFTMQEIANILGHSDLQMLIKHYAKYVENKAINADRKINLFGDTLGDTFKKVDFS